MQPAASLKFTDDELNNAMGTNFYQRDRDLKQRKQEIQNATLNMDNNDGSDYYNFQSAFMVLK